jgi:hypothetical protein
VQRAVRLRICRRRRPLLLAHEIEARDQRDLRGLGAAMLLDQQPGHLRVGRDDPGLSGNARGAKRVVQTVVVLTFRATVAFGSYWGQKRRSARAPMTSGLPRRTDILSVPRPRSFCCTPLASRRAVTSGRS